MPEMMTGKRALLEMLKAEGVEYIFGNPGTSEGPIIDLLKKRQRVISHGADVPQRSAPIEPHRVERVGPRQSAQARGPRAARPAHRLDAAQRPVLADRKSVV